MTGWAKAFGCARVKAIESILKFFQNFSSQLPEKKNEGRHRHRCFILDSG